MDEARKRYLTEQLRTFDRTDPEQIRARCKDLVGLTFGDVLDLGVYPPDALTVVAKDYAPRGYKGGVGNLIEERYFGYRANSRPEPDFEAAGVELKTTPLDRLRRPDVRHPQGIRAGERLVLTMISYSEPIDAELLGSHLWWKLGHLMIVWYERDKAIDTFDQRIEYAYLYEPPQRDLAIMEDDYRKIAGLIRAGQAQDLSERLTLYLAASTKGSTAEKSRKPQYYGDHSEAKGRAFSLKRSYMDTVLYEMVLPEAAREAAQAPTDTIDRAGQRVGETFEGYVRRVVGGYAGMTDVELCRLFGIEYTGNKAQWVTLTYRMLGVRGHADEFRKANLSVRTVREKYGGKGLAENLSLSPFRFSGLLAEPSWEESTLHDYLDETRFFFVVFERTEPGRGKVPCRLRGCCFWDMPTEDMEGPVRTCWERTRERLRAGVTLTVVSDGRRWKVLNDLPAQSDGLVAHVRPHASRSGYLIGDDRVDGGWEGNGDRLPDGRYMTRQSFWLNGDYLHEQLVRQGL